MPNTVVENATNAATPPNYNHSVFRANEETISSEPYLAIPVSKTWTLSDNTKTITTPDGRSVTVRQLVYTLNHKDIDPPTVLPGGWIEKPSNFDFDEDSVISENSYIYDEARVHGGVNLLNECHVMGEAEVKGINVSIFDSVIKDTVNIMTDEPVTIKSSTIGGNTGIYNNCIIKNSTIELKQYLEAYKSTYIPFKAIIEKCVIDDVRQIITLGPVGSRFDYVTFVYQNGEIRASTGCFKQTIDKFHISVLDKIIDIVSEDNNQFKDISLFPYADYRIIIDYVTNRFKLYEAIVNDIKEQRKYNTQEPEFEKQKGE